MGNNIENIVNSGLCVGCGSCVFACKNGALEICETLEGFLLAKVQKEKCVSCGKCLSVCPAEAFIESEFNEDQDHSPDKQLYCRKVFYGYITDEKKRMQSTSGGIATAICEEAQSVGGKAYGAVLDLSDGDICHKSTDKVSLETLAKTKYCQSNFIEVVAEIREDLQQNRKVVFTGTPCQAYGLRKGLADERQENLLIIDLICYGVPSRKIFREYYNELAQDGGVQTYEFRSKCNGWPAHTVRYESNGKEKVSKATLDRYQFLFQEGLSLNSGCFHCPFKEKHHSDIIVGDFWAYGKIKDLDSSLISKGLSMVIANTPKGYEFLKNAVDSDEIYIKEINADFITDVLHKQVFDEEKYKKRNAFFKYYLENGYKDTIKKYASFGNMLAIKANGIISGLKQRIR